jgi:hypothetical protein
MSLDAAMQHPLESVELATVNGQSASSDPPVNSRFSTLCRWCKKFVFALAKAIIIGLLGGVVVGTFIFLLWSEVNGLSAEQYVRAVITSIVVCMMVIALIEITICIWNAAGYIYKSCIEHRQRVYTEVI